MIVQSTQPTLSASSLQVFEACERLYEYTFVAPRPWPAPANQDQEGSEAIMERGQRLHHLIHLHAHGHDPRPLARTDERLQNWFTRYRASSFAQMEGEVFSEQTLTLQLDGRALVVKLDRVVRDGDRWLILDWKTSKRAIEAHQLEDDWQARLYPYALVEAGAVLNGGVPIAPENIEMVFFYLEPGTQVRLAYDIGRHQATKTLLEGRLRRIASVADTGHAPTGKQGGRCEKPPCRFYSLCHMATLPATEFRADVDEETAESEVELLLTLRVEFEFDDEPVCL